LPIFTRRQSRQGFVCNKHATLAQQDAGTSEAGNVEADTRGYTCAQLLKAVLHTTKGRVSSFGSLKKTLLTCENSSIGFNRSAASMTWACQIARVSVCVHARTACGLTHAYSVCVYIVSACHNPSANI